MHTPSMWFAIPMTITWANGARIDPPNCRPLRVDLMRTVPAPWKMSSQLCGLFACAFWSLAMSNMSYSRRTLSL